MKNRNILKAVTAVAVAGLIPLTFMGNTWNVDDTPVYYTPMETYTLYGGTVYNSGQYTTEISAYNDEYYTDLGKDGNSWFEKTTWFFTFSFGFQPDQGQDTNQDVLELSLDNTIVPCFMLDTLLKSKAESNELWFDVNGACTAIVDLTLSKQGDIGEYHWQYAHTSLTSPSTLLGANGNSWEQNVDMRDYAYSAGNLSAPFYYVESLTITLNSQPLTEIESNFGFREEETYTTEEYATAQSILLAYNGGGTITPPPVIIEPSPTELLFAPIESFLRLELFPGFSVETLLIIAVAIGVFGVFLKFYAGG